MLPSPRVLRIPIGRSIRASLSLAVLLLATSLNAAFNVTISSTGPQSGGSFIKGVWTPTNPSSVILVASLLAELEKGDVTILTAGKGFEPGNITIQSVLPLDDLITTKSPTLTLHALNDILVNASLSQATKGGDDKPTRVHLVLNANSDRSGGGSAQINAAIALAGGTLTVGGEGVAQTAASSITTGGGDVGINVAGPVSLAGTYINSGGGSISVRAGSTLSSTLISLVSEGGPITLTSTGSMAIVSPTSTSGGTFTAQVTGPGTLSLQNDVTTSGGNVLMTTANGLLQTTLGATINSSGGAGTGSLRIESLAATGALVLGGDAFGSAGGITLQSGGDLTINAPVNGNGGPVLIRANADNGPTGNLSVNAAVATTGPGSVTAGGVDFTQSATGTFSTAAGPISGAFSGSVTVSRGITSINGPVSLTGASLILNSALSGGGGITLSGGSIVGNAGGTLTSENQAISITSAGLTDLIGAVQSNGGTLTIQSGSTLDVGAGILSSAGGNILLSAAGTLHLTGPITTSGGSLTVQSTAAGEVQILNDLTTSGGTIRVSTGNGPIQSSAGSTLDVGGGAGTGAIFLTARASLGSITLNGDLQAGSGGTELRADLDLLINAPIFSGGPVTLRANADSIGTGSLFLAAPVTTVGSASIVLAGVNLTQSGTGSVSAASGNLIGTFSGSATVARALSSTTGSLTLTAGTLTLSAAVSGGGGVTLAGAVVIGNAGGTITSQNRPILITAAASADIISAIESNGGPITVQAGSTLELGTGILASAGGIITLTSSGNMTLVGPIVTGGGSFRASVTGAGTLSIQNDITTSGGSLEVTTAIGLLQSTVGSTLDASGGAGTGSIRAEALSASGNVLLNGNVLGSGGGTVLRAGGDVTLNDSVQAGGPVVLRANSDDGGLGSLAVNAPVTVLGTGTLTLGGVGFTQTLTGTLSTTAGAILGTFTGPATVSRSLTSASGSLTLNGPSLNINAPISGGGGVTLSGGTINGNSGGTFTSQNAPISITSTAATDIISAILSNGGSISIQAGTTLDLGTGLLGSAGGPVTLSAIGNLTLFGPVTTAGAAFTARVTGAGALAIQNDVTTSGGSIELTTANGMLSSTAGSDLDASGGAGTGTIRADSLALSGALTLAGPVTTTGGKVTLRAGGHLTVNAAVTAGGGSGIELVANSLKGALGDLVLSAPVTLNSAGPILLNGVALLQSGTGAITSAGGPINGSFSSKVQLSRNVASGGGRIAFTGLGGISVESLLSTAPPDGGSGRLLTSTGVTIKTTPILGNADIVLIGTTVQAPTVVDPITSDAGPTSITLGAFVKDDGGMQILERGMVLALASVNPQPSLGGNGVTRLVSPATTGAFSVGASGLIPGQTYAFRAFATNAAGTSYTKTGTFLLPTPIQDWRRQFFGSPANTGIGANSATPDGDGIPNLIKYALVLPPGKALSSDLPPPIFVEINKASHLAIELLRDPARTDISIHVEASGDLHDWSTVASSERGAPYEGKGFVSEREVQRSLRLALIRDLADASVQPVRFLRVRVEPTSKD